MREPDAARSLSRRLRLSRLHLVVVPLVSGIWRYAQQQVGGGKVSERQWVLEHFERPLPINQFWSKHFHERRRITENWRTTFGWLARQARVPKLSAAVITVGQGVRHGTTLPDVGACFPAAKAAIDGLVDAGVLPNDTPQYVRRPGLRRA